MFLFPDWRFHDSWYSGATIYIYLLFSDRKSSKRPNPNSTTFQDFPPGWNITVSFSRMIHLKWLQWMSPSFGAMFVARRLQIQRTCQHVQGESQGHAINNGQLFLFCIEFAWFSCPCRHEPGSPMARHLCMQLANLGSNTGGFSEMMWDPKPVLTDLISYRLILYDNYSRCGVCMMLCMMAHTYNGSKSSQTHLHLRLNLMMCFFLTDLSNALWVW